MYLRIMDEVCEPREEGHEPSADADKRTVAGRHRTARVDRCYGVDFHKGKRMAEQGKQLRDGWTEFHGRLRIFWVELICLRKPQSR